MADESQVFHGSLLLGVPDPTTIEPRPDRHAHISHIGPDTVSPSCARYRPPLRSSGWRKEVVQWSAKRRLLPFASPPWSPERAPPERAISGICRTPGRHLSSRASFFLAAQKPQRLPRFCSAS